MLVWPDTAFNLKLGVTFKGIERHMSDRLIGEATSERVSGDETRRHPRGRAQGLFNVEGKRLLDRRKRV